MFCGINPPSSEKCDDCVYFTKTKELKEKISQLWKRFEDRIELIAPSEFVRQLYSQNFKEYHIVTVPHQVRSGIYKRPAKKQKIITVAFVGYANKTKGWDDFERVVEKYAGEDIVYCHYGKGGEDNKKIKHVTIDTTKSPNAMVDALRKDNVDITVLWSILPETYSYAYNECLMTGSVIIANESSGNIAQSVIRDHTGLVLRNSQDLLHVITDKDKLEMLIHDYAYISPEVFSDNEWIINNLGHAIRTESSTYKTKSGKEHIILKFLYSLKWKVKG